MASTDVSFTSRSSAASIPLNVEAQTRVWVFLNPSPVSPPLSVQPLVERLCRFVSGDAGGDGCAYGCINPMDPMWIATLVGIVTVSPQALPVSVVVQLSPH